MPTSIDYTDAQFPIAGECMATLLQRIDAIANDAWDHLLASKIDQAEFANQHQHPDPIYTISNNVLLSTLHRRRDYQSLDSSHVAKFMPHYNGPYRIMAAHPATSSYTLDLPHSPNICPSFHSSELHPFLPNNDTLYPSHTLAHPPPVMNDGIEDWSVNKILAARKRGCGWQYKVQWTGWGQENLRWIPGSDLQHCAAMDAWCAAHPHRKVTLLLPTQPPN